MEFGRRLERKKGRDGEERNGKEERGALRRSGCDREEQGRDRKQGAEATARGIEEDGNRGRGKVEGEGNITSLL